MKGYMHLQHIEAAISTIYARISSFTKVCSSNLVLGMEYGIFS